MRAWTVAGGLIESDGRLLLVQNQRRDGSLDWTTPGGVVDPGEELLEGLTREVEEETGLTVSGWEGPLWIVEAEAPDMGWTLVVEVHRAVGFEGETIRTASSSTSPGSTWPSARRASVRRGCRPASR